jgi:XRE family transcriptional regulator, fatty acid utilization regulator
MFAGGAVRRHRLRLGVTQAAMAEVLGISASYLALVERNQRPLSATLLVALAERYDLDPRALTGAEPGGGVDAMRRRLADPMFADLEVDRAELLEWLAAAPGGAEAFARAFDRLGGATAPAGADDPAATVRREVERWRNHYPDLDAAAEALADEMRMQAGDLYGALVERLRARHQIAIRILPVDVLPDVLRRLDLHARQLQLSELLAPASRLFAVASQLAQLEARGELDGLVRGAGFRDRTAERLYRRHLVGYWAAALIMPYARFLRACEASGYDLDLLGRRFGASVEQVAHRLTTLGRVGARGLPFFGMRVDRAGQVSKAFAGPSGAPLADGQGRCPLWRVDDEGAHLLELENGQRWVTLARPVVAQGRGPGGVRGLFLVVVGVEAGLAGQLSWSVPAAATPIGPGCRRCLRQGCPQRSSAPAGRAVVANELERRVSGWSFAGD